MSHNRIDIQKIHVIDKFDISEDDIRNIANLKNGCGVIIIDYYQLLNPVLASKLSKIAKELSLHIIVSSLLPRDFEDLNAGNPISKFDESTFEFLIERIVVISQSELEFHVIGGLKFTEKI